MKCLSIDLDYIMYPEIGYYNELMWDQNPGSRWTKLREIGYHRPEKDYNIDQSNLIFVYNTFLTSLRNCDSVSFGYEHDSILFELEKHDNIELVNIDHHNDYLNGIFTSDNSPEPWDKEYHFLKVDGILDEGNWGAWLQQQGKLKSMHWIGPPEIEQGKWAEAVAYFQTHSHFSCGIKENYEMEYDYDHIFVCLSPQYVPPSNWHYFSMFISAYETFTNKKAVIHVNKYGHKVKLKSTHEFIKNQITHRHFHN